MLRNYSEESLKMVREIMGSYESPSASEMKAIFELCKKDDWQAVTSKVKHNPFVAVSPIVMDNNITTTIMHQAITSKADVSIRARLVDFIIDNTPAAAAIKNGYGSLPLHVICQRNTKLKSAIKQRLILRLCKAYPGGMEQYGGVGKRTPLHIVFTDYISPGVTKHMLEHGSKAAFMRDKKGFLPAHVACQRHSSPEKIRMLLRVNPEALYEKTNAGETLLQLATRMATKSHPNYALIEELKSQLGANENDTDALMQPEPVKDVKPEFFLNLVDGNQQPSTPPLEPEPLMVTCRRPHAPSWNMFEGMNLPPTKRFKYMQEQSDMNPVEHPEYLLLNFAHANTTSGASVATAARVSLDGDDNDTSHGGNEASVAV